MKLAPEGRLADELAQNSGVSDLQPSAAMERQEAATGLMSQISKLPRPAARGAASEIQCGLELQGNSRSDRANQQ